MANTFIVTGSYATWSGNMRTFRFELQAADHDAAFEAARAKLESDKRRNFMGKLSMDI